LSNSIQQLDSRTKEQFEVANQDRLTIQKSLGETNRVIDRNLQTQDKKNQEIQNLIAQTAQKLESQVFSAKELSRSLHEETNSKMDKTFEQTRNQMFSNLTHLEDRINA